MKVHITYRCIYTYCLLEVFWISDAKESPTSLAIPLVTIQQNNNNNNNNKIKILLELIQADKIFCTNFINKLLHLCANCQFCQQTRNRWVTPFSVYCCCCWNILIIYIYLLWRLNNSNLMRYFRWQFLRPLSTFFSIKSKIEIFSSVSHPFMLKGSARRYLQTHHVEYKTIYSHVLL